MLSSPLQPVLTSPLQPVVGGIQRNAAALSLDFLSGVADSRLTTSGGANGTRVNSAGVIVAASCPRFDYDPVTLLPKGLLVEEARTNLLLNSDTLSTQSVTVTAQAYTLSFYGTGTVTLSGTSTAGPAVGTGAYPSRQTLTFTPTAGILTLTVTGSVRFAQLEAGSFATSYIPTTATAVTRTADSVSMTGADFSSWFNASEGTFIYSAEVLDTSSNRFAVSANDATVNNELSLHASTAYNNLVTAGGVAQANSFVNVAPVANTVFKDAMAYATNDIRGCANGTLGAQDTSATLPAVNQLTIGRRGNGTFIFNGRIRSIRHYSRRLPDGILQALTA